MTRFNPITMCALIGIVLTGCQSSKTSDEESGYPMPVIRVDDEDREAIEAKNRAVEKELQLVVDFEHDLWLEEAIAYVRNMSGQNIAVNWSALDIVGIERHTPVTIHVKNITLERLLRIALDQVSSDAFDDDKAGYTIKDGIICISTLREVKEQTHYAVYNVGWYILPPGLTYRWLYRDHPRAAELLELVRSRREQLDRVNRPGFDLNEVFGSTSSGSQPSRRGKDAYEIAEDTPATRLEFRIDELIEVIQFTVGDPDEWLDEVSTIMPLTDKFIIKTTCWNHQQIEQVLTAIYHAEVAEIRHQSQQIEVFLILDDAEALRFKQDYKNALRKIEQALRVDPYNAKALALKQVIKETLSR